MKKTLNILFQTMVITALSGSLLFAANVQQAEIDEFLDGLGSPSIMIRIETAKRITNSTLTDERLFDQIEQMLVENYRAKGYDEDGIDEVSWLCKALASSGNEKYRPAIRKVAENSNSGKIENYCNQSLDLIATYRQRNADINKQGAAISGLSVEENRIVNMLRSDDLNLKRDAAKMVSRDDNVDPKIYDIIEEELLANYDLGQSDNLHADSMAWLCKALASSQDQKYAPAFRTIFQKAPNKKIKSYARRSLSLMGSHR